MRVVLVVLLVAACGSGDDGEEQEGPPIGDVTVTVYTNGGGGSHQFPGRPVADAYVFTTGTLVRSDADGIAVIPVSRESSTIHVLLEAEKRLYTLTEIPVGASIRVGDRRPTEAAGGVSFMLPAITDAMYWITTPSCLSASSGTTPQASPSFFMTYRATCAGRTLRVYGFAREPSGAEHVSEVSARLQVSTASTVGPYVDPVPYSVDIANLPPGIGELTVTPVYLPTDSDQDVEAGSTVMATAVGSTATIAGTTARGANALELLSMTGTATAYVLARHDITTTTFDATMMLPLPEAFAINGGRVSWQLDPAGRNIDGFTLDAGITSANLTWLVWGGPTTREVAVPSKYPAEVPLALDDATLSIIQLRYFDALGKDRPFDIERNGIAGPDGVAWTNLR